MSYNQFIPIESLRQTSEERTTIQEEYSMIEEETFCLQSENLSRIKDQAQSPIMYQPFANLRQCSMKSYKERSPFGKEKILKRLRKTEEQQDENYHYYKKLNSSNSQPQYRLQCTIQGCFKTFSSIQAYYSHLQIKHNSESLFKSNSNQTHEILLSKNDQRSKTNSDAKFGQSRVSFSQRY